MPSWRIGLSLKRLLLLFTPSHLRSARTSLENVFP
uniref:Uncharacterized protein n=1 Tax=Anguilla anguilla TaxID=7936 RepID=A0A0E9PG29_ANGAN